MILPITASNAAPSRKRMGKRGVKNNSNISDVARFCIYISTRLFLATPPRRLAHRLQVQNLRHLELRWRAVGDGAQSKHRREVASPPVKLRKDERGGVVVARQVDEQRLGLPLVRRQPR